MDRPLALVLDPDPATREQVSRILERHGLCSQGAASVAESGAARRGGRLRLVVADLDAPGIEAGGLLEEAAGSGPPVLGLSGVRDDGRARSLVERGMFDVLAKPLDEARLDLCIRRALRQQQLMEEVRTLREELRQRAGHDGIVGRSPGIEGLREQIAWLAGSDAAVWFWGERGSGKKLAARTLHAKSPRAGARFVVLECSGLNLGSWSSRLGLDASGRPAPEGFLASVAGGTLYLDDPAALEPAEQQRLLHTLDGAAACGVHFRVVASSAADPVALAAAGRLEESLRARLAQNSLAVPALRERAEDIPLLARHFVAALCALNQLPPIRLTPDALAILARQPWPDNVLGLRDALERAVILSPDGSVRPRDLPDRARQDGPASAALSGSFREEKRKVVESFEQAYLRDLMAQHRGNVTSASLQAGMLRSALQRLLRRYHLKSAEFRREHQAPAAAAAESIQPPR